MSKILTTVAAALLAVILVAALTIRTLEAPAVETNDRMAPPAEVGGHMAAAADAFIGTLSTDQRDQGTWELDAEQRVDWHFIPRARYGVLLTQLRTAIIETEAPRDIITGNARTVEFDAFQGGYPPRR